MNAECRCRTGARPEVKLTAQYLTLLAPRSWWLSAAPRDPCSGRTVLRREKQTPLQISTAVLRPEEAPQPGEERERSGPPCGAQLGPRPGTSQGSTHGGRSQHPCSAIIFPSLREEASKIPHSADPPQSDTHRTSRNSQEADGRRPAPAPFQRTQQRQTLARALPQADRAPSSSQIRRLKLLGCARTPSPAAWDEHLPPHGQTKHPRGTPTASRHVPPGTDTQQQRQAKAEPTVPLGPHIPEARQPQSRGPGRGRSEGASVTPHLTPDEGVLPSVTGLGRLGGSIGERLPAARVVVLGCWDGAPHRLPASPSPRFCSFSLSLSPPPPACILSLFFSL